MDYLTNYYKNLSEQLQNKVNILSSQIKFLNESANPDPGDLQSPWQTPYNNPYSPSQPYWEPPEPQPTRRPGRGMIPSIDDVYPPESPTKLRGRPIPELGVVNDEREKSVEEWMLDMLPKEIRELFIRWKLFGGPPHLINYFWELWQKLWLERQSQWGNERYRQEERNRMIKEFEKIWKIYQEKWFKEIDPAKSPFIEDLIYEYFKMKKPGGWPPAGDLT